VRASLEYAQIYELIRGFDSTDFGRQGCWFFGAAVVRMNAADPTDVKAGSRLERMSALGR
jgi:hypothetical protein